ncbi:hypothetical protein [Streptomyces hydrogenans]|uniref:hypothetical protein n=1 Tax=Streptomyces hydrogenans TaxID=1873719 RepID=UPI003814CDC1
MPHAARVLRAFRRARPVEPGSYDTITRLPSRSHAGESEPDRPRRDSLQIPPLTEDEIALRVQMLLYTGEFSGQAGAS